MCMDRQGRPTLRERKRERVREMSSGGGRWKGLGGGRTPDYRDKHVV
jgi:hypothetical protein